VDGDGVVTAADVGIVAASIGSVPPLPIQADATADGLVSAADLAFVGGAVGLITPCQGKVFVDTDLDGCTDIEERGPMIILGGLRAPADYYDFYDTPAVPGGMKDAVVTLGGDIISVAMRFGAAGPVALPGSALPGDPLLLPIPPPPLHHSAFDRSAGTPALSGPADGVIGVPFDILEAAGQFGHTCVMPP
jgi:hypothetical protein